MIVAVVGLAREARIVSGPGIVVSRRAIDLPQLINQDVEGIISIGIAAGLDPSLKVCDCVIASHVVADGTRVETDRRWSEALAARLNVAVSSPVMPAEAGIQRASARLDSRLRGNDGGMVHLGGVVGSGEVVVSAEDKAILHAKTEALAADMESHIAARAAQAFDIPFAALRVISDDAGHALPSAALAAMTPDGSINPGAVLRSLIGRPAQIGALMRTARDAEAAFGALLRCRRALGPRLACPYLG